LFAHAASFNVLHEFTAGTDGEFPFASLVQDSAGNLYGTTIEGGGSGCYGSGCGTVFRVTPEGDESVVYAFQGGNDGDSPSAGLILDGNGNLYGTTAVGGNPHCRYSEKPYGCGTVFKLTPQGVETILHAFAGGKDGSEPEGNLAMDQAGDLFGATIDGGAVGKRGKEGCGDRRGCGTVFEIGADGTKTVLHSFRGGKDGAIPFGNVLLDVNGNLYGTTVEGGGASVCPHGCGAVYRISPDGEEKVLYRFQGASDGEEPGGLIMNGTGDLFGVTSSGGETTCKCGTIFKITSKGHEDVLYAFKGGSDGIDPDYAPLAMDASGNLYGATIYGGGNQAGCADGCGTVFEFSTDNKETTLYALPGGSGGDEPFGGVAVDASGDLFGTTYAGGDTACPGSNGWGCGLVFELANGTMK
jgi:uncharacterized repeat protein (TIGR03803 family)